MLTCDLCLLDDVQTIATHITTYQDQVIHLCQGHVKPYVNDATPLDEWKEYQDAADRLDAWATAALS